MLPETLRLNRRRLRGGKERLRFRMKVFDRILDVYLNLDKEKIAIGSARKITRFMVRIFKK